MVITPGLSRKLKSILETSIVLTHKVNGGAHMVDNLINPFVDAEGKHHEKRFSNKKP